MATQTFQNTGTTSVSGNGSDVARQVLVIVAIIATVAFNGISQAIKLGGTDNAALSASFQNFYILPANYAFSIWGIIYTFLFAYMVYQGLPAQKANPKLRKIGWWVVANGVANMLWLVAFQYRQFPLSAVLMLFILVSLIVIYLQINNGDPVTTRERWLVHVPFSIYLGWICVATIVNVSVVLNEAGWDRLGLSYQAWTVIMLGVATVLAAIISFTRRDAALVLVFVWAFTAITVRQEGQQTVQLAALILAGVIAVILAIAVVLRRPRGSATSSASMA